MLVLAAMRVPEFQQRFVGPGARLELIAPAGPFDVAAFEHGVARLSRRYDVRYDPGICARQGYLAGDDTRRLAELRGALARHDTDAIIAARGGYGATRILPLVAADEVRAAGKLLVGFSDITALHALWAHAGVCSVHGPMVAALGRCEERQFSRFCAALEGDFPALYDGLETIAPGASEGVLLGGNLTVLTALLGTPAFPPLTDAVLFLEDTGERPYRVDRMLTTWRNAGAFRGVRAVVLGAFTHAEPGADGVSVEQVLCERLYDLGMPVLRGLPAGHLDDNCELPFGARVSVDASAGRLQLQVGRNA
jgi:muramoyltetrapeptide carboxypeptidase